LLHTEHCKLLHYQAEGRSHKVNFTTAVTVTDESKKHSDKFWICYTDFHSDWYV